MKYLLGIIILFSSLVAFMLMEYGKIVISVKESILPLFFSLTVATIFLNSKFKKSIPYILIVLFVLMIILYLMNLLTLSNLVGSLGFGIFIILILSYIPQLIKNGHI